jgi:hypothetical protein
MLIKKLKTQENEGAKSKFPEHTVIKVFGHIPEVFLALKIILFSDRSCFFSASVEELPLLLTCAASFSCQL